MKLKIAAMVLTLSLSQFSQAETLSGHSGESATQSMALVGHSLASGGAVILGVSAVPATLSAIGVAGTGIAAETLHDDLHDSSKDFEISQDVFTKTPTPSEAMKQEEQ